jgi:hypothetical protein
MLIKRAWVVIAAVLLMMAANVNAATILFDFDGPGIADGSCGTGITCSTGNTIGTGGVVDPIEVYMEGLYGSDITVDWGAKVEDDRTEGLTSTYPYLGSTNGAIDRFGNCGTGPCDLTSPDRFLINRWNSSLPSTLRDRITITFEIVPITGLEFDWEIFPVTQSGQNADLTVRVWTQQQIDDEDLDGTVIFFSQLLGSDKPLGDMGHQSFTFDDPITRISFIDWNDAPIGVDNLRLTQTPVPGTLVLLGAGFLALGLGKARRRRAKKPEGSSPTST